MTRQGVDGKERRLCPGLERQAGEHARQRQRQTCGRMSLGRVEIGSAGRDARRELQARAFAVGGVTLERRERERVRRRDLDRAAPPSSPRSARAAARTPRSRRAARARPDCLRPRLRGRRAPSRATRRSGSPRDWGRARARGPAGSRDRSRRGRRARCGSQPARRARRAIGRGRLSAPARRSADEPPPASRRRAETTPSRRGDQDRGHPAVLGLHDVVDPQRGTGRHDLETEAGLAQRLPQRLRRRRETLSRADDKKLDRSRTLADFGEQGRQRDRVEFVERRRREPAARPAASPEWSRDTTCRRRRSRRRRARRSRGFPARRARRESEPSRLRFRAPPPRLPCPSCRTRPNGRPCRSASASR